MSVYVVEIKGRAIIAFNADTKSDAIEMVHNEAFRADLGGLELDSQPLWDGSAEILLREASARDYNEWILSRSRAVAAGDLARGAEDWVAFLLPVRDPRAA